MLPWLPAAAHPAATISYVENGRLTARANIFRADPVNRSGHLYPTPTQKVDDASRRAAHHHAQP